jgi:PAS domain S-box-containing protein
MDLAVLQTLREVLRRVDEVRGLAEPAGDSAWDALERPEGLIRTLHDLVQELERGHRRLIETHVQLVSLREVVSSTVDALDSDQTTRMITRYLARAFGFQDVFLLIANRENGTLEGSWTHVDQDHHQSYPLELPLIGDGGTPSRAAWLNRTIVQHAAAPHLAVALAQGHPLHDVLDRVGSAACTPLQRSSTLRASAELEHACSPRCILGDISVLAPPPGPAAGPWSDQREERQRSCLACPALPVLGVIGVAWPSAGPAPGPGDVAQLESIALSVAPVVENARLYQELRRSERFREHVLDSMSSALVAVNMKGEILTFNRAAEALLGFSEAEVLGQPFGAQFGSDGELLIREVLEQGRENLRVEITLRARDGSPVPVSLTTSLLRNERRNVYGAIATFLDLTPLKKAEEHARRLDRLAALGRFTSSVAHEIRNPLTGIASGIQYLARALGDDGPQRQNLEFIQSEIRRLDRIVQDLFDVTHPRGLQLRAAPLEDTLGRALQSLDALLQQRGIEVRLLQDRRVPPVAHDSDQIQQVLINLIKNAAEASPAGGAITIGIAPGTAAVAGGRARPSPVGCLTVEDQGSGIPAEALKTVFEPFFTTKPGGTGLGLYISHDIVKRHGGSLAVSSAPGRGARFIVELPLEQDGGTS